MNQQLLFDFVHDFNANWVGPILSVILLFTGLYYTIRLGFVQRYFFLAIRRLVGGGRKGKASRSEGITPFQALSAAVASQVGTGNIVGVATALMSGGPGALFWMWISSLLGMATNFSEAVLGQLYRTKRMNHAVGGPAFYIRQGLKSRVLAAIFAIFGILSLGLMGTMVQANSIVDSMASFLPAGVNKLYIGIPLALLIFSVLAGGVTRIVAFAERVVPFMASLFIVGAMVYIGLRAEAVPGVFREIFQYAFTPYAAAGGVAGTVVMQTIRYGISRGLFSNEAGLGSTPHAHAIAQVKRPYDQGLVALLGVGTTLIICTLSGLVILLSGVLQTRPDLQGVEIAQTAFLGTFGVWGKYFVGIALFFFAFTTSVGWYFFAAQNMRYLCGDLLIWPLRAAVAVMVVLSSVTEVSLVWELADTFNFFLVIPNVIALLFLSPQVIREAKRLHLQVREERLAKRGA